MILKTQKYYTRKSDRSYGKMGFRGLYGETLEGENGRTTCKGAKAGLTD